MLRLFSFLSPHNIVHSQQYTAQTETERRSSTRLVSKFSMAHTVPLGGEDTKFLADRISTVALILQCCVCLSVVCDLCIVAKRCVSEQKLLLTAYRKSYMRNRLVPKRMTLTFVQRRLFEKILDIPHSQSPCSHLRALWAIYCTSRLWPTQS